MVFKKRVNTYLCMYICIPDEVIHFPNHMPIEISYGNVLSYSKCKTYDAKIMSQGFVWHQIVVHHNTKSLSIESRNEILKGLYEAIEGEEIYPIAYRVSINF